VVVVDVFAVLALALPLLVTGQGVGEEVGLSVFPALVSVFPALALRVFLNSWEHLVMGASAGAVLVVSEGDSLGESVVGKEVGL